MTEKRKKVIIIGDNTGEKLAVLLHQGEKPPVLSDESIKVVIPRYNRIDACVCELNDIKAIAQAQYDALVAYYEPLIQQTKEEVAREILEVAESRCVHLHSRYRHQPQRLCEECWQSLKSKHLKG